MPPDAPLYGGRALPNGVMMVGPGRMAIAIRKSDGTVATASSEFTPPLAGARTVPFLRGLMSISGAVILAVRSARLRRSISHDGGGQGRQIPRTMLPMIALSLFDAAIRAVGRKRTGTTRQPGIVRLFMPLVGFKLMGMSPSGRDLLRYHAAEHMAVNAAETGEPLTVNSAMRQSRIHPRCGTTFAVWALLLSRVTRGRMRGALPTILSTAAIISVSFELLSFGSRNRHLPWVQKVFGPTWQAQLLTTMPSTESHVEVAVAALNEVLGAASKAIEPASDIV